MKVMTAIARWTEGGGGKEAGESTPVTLEPALYGKCDEEDGWFVHEPDGEIADLHRALCSVEKSMQAHIVSEFMNMNPNAEYGVSDPKKLSKL